jgi:hypothetical protein
MSTVDERRLVLDRKEQERKVSARLVTKEKKCVLQ